MAVEREVLKLLGWKGLVDDCVKQKQRSGHERRAVKVDAARRSRTYLRSARRT